MIAVLWMEAGSVPDDNVLVPGELGLDLFEEGFGPVQVDGGRLHEDRLAIDHVNSPVAVAPLVFTFPAFVRTMTFLRPDAPQVRQ